MVGQLYGILAPVAGAFVGGFFWTAYRVFKFMTLYIYGNRYESGGEVFYTLTQLFFFCVYSMIILFAGYISLHATAVMAGVSVLLLLITALVQREMLQSFIEPSRTLSLAKARYFDAPPETTIHTDAVGNGTRFIGSVIVDEKVTIGSKCSIGPNVYIERGAVINDRVVLEDSVVLRGTQIKTGVKASGKVIW